MQPIKILTYLTPRSTFSLRSTDLELFSSTAPTRRPKQPLHTPTHVTEQTQIPIPLQLINNGSSTWRSSPAPPNCRTPGAQTRCPRPGAAASLINGCCPSSKVCTTGVAGRPKPGPGIVWTNGFYRCVSQILLCGCLDPELSHQSGHFDELSFCVFFPAIPSLFNPHAYIC